MNKKLILGIITLLLTSIILFFSCISASAKSAEDFSITLPDEYITAFHDDNKSDIADAVGISADEVDDYFQKHNLKFLSVNKDNTSQIKLSVLEDDFSKKIISFNNLNNENILKLANSLFTGSYEQVSNGVKIVENNGIKFLKYKENLSDNGGEYTVTQYVTVYNSKTYRLSVFVTGEEQSDLSDTVFNSFSLKQNSDALSPLVKIFIIVGIVIFAVIIVLSIFR